MQRSMIDIEASEINNLTKPNLDIIKKNQHSQRHELVNSVWLRGMLLIELHNYKIDFNWKHPFYNQLTSLRR